MNDDPIVISALQALAKFNPKSVFLYGSRGRGDAKPDSDYEIGVVFDDDKYVQRSDIQAAIASPQVKAYPFKWSELRDGAFGFVFQKSLYMREIVKGGKTIAGEDLLGQIAVPPITTLDLVQDIRFYVARALDAMVVFREGHTELGAEIFSKSCFLGLRCLEILELKTFPVGYDEIYELSGKVVTEPEYRAVIEAAYALRKGGQMPSIDVLFKNISLLDTFIEPKIIEAFKVRSNEELL